MYAWAITKDHIADESVKEGTHCNAKGVIGPRNVELSYDEIINHSDRRFFQLYDDDGELYYEGYFIGDDEAEGFEPLEDFGMPNAGATEIRYYNEETHLMESL